MQHGCNFAACLTIMAGLLGREGSNSNKWCIDGWVSTHRLQEELFHQFTGSQATEKLVCACAVFRSMQCTVYAEGTGVQLLDERV